MLPVLPVASDQNKEYFKITYKPPWYSLLNVLRQKRVLRIFNNDELLEKLSNKSIKAEHTLFNRITSRVTAHLQLHLDQHNAQ